MDAFVPLEMTRAMADTAKKNAPSLVISDVGQNGSDNVILNHKRPPFDNVSVRTAISLAMDRNAYVRGPPARVGGRRRPHADRWLLGLGAGSKTLPGYGRRRDKPRPSGCSPPPGTGRQTAPFELVTRTIPVYLDVAPFVAISSTSRRRGHGQAGRLRGVVPGARPPR